MIMQSHSLEHSHVLHACVKTFMSQNAMKQPPNTGVGLHRPVHAHRLTPDDELSSLASCDMASSKYNEFSDLKHQCAVQSNIP